MQLIGSSKTTTGVIIPIGGETPGIKTGGVKTLYDILEVDSTATAAEISRAYRVLALRYHPDKNLGDAQAEEKFKEVSNAYEILLDSEKRAAYDKSLQKVEETIAPPDEIISEEKKVVINNNVSSSSVKKLIDILGKLKPYLDKPTLAITETGARIIRTILFGYYSYLNKPCYVQRSSVDPVSESMQKFLLNRTKYVQVALQKYFNLKFPTEKVPKIAFAISGGGMRACLTGAGFLAGAEQTGLLDCTMFSAGISGGTWAIGPASYSFAKSYPHNSFTDFKNNLVKHLDTVLAVPGTDFKLPAFIQYPASNGVARNYLRRMGWDQPITTIDLWGSLVANTVLQGLDGWDQTQEGKRFDVCFSEINTATMQGILPLPMLATAIPVSAGKAGDPHGYWWMKYTPLEAVVQAEKEEIRVPMWAMGRLFIEGVNDLTYEGFAPEYSLAYLLGACGSAFTINLKYFYGDENPSLNVAGFNVKIPLDMMGLNDMRLFPFKIKNFTENVSQSPLYGKEFLSVVDAGICLNIPTPIVTQPADTAADIIFMVDASSDVFDEKNVSETLQTMNRYVNEMHPNTLPFIDPSIGYKMYINESVMHIFNDPRDPDYDSKLPVAIYMPLIRNQNFSKTFDPAAVLGNKNSAVKIVYKGRNFLDTFNFLYSQTEASLVTDLMEKNVKDSMKDIKNMLLAYAAKH